MFPQVDKQKSPIYEVPISQLSYQSTTTPPSADTLKSIMDMDRKSGKSRIALIVTVILLGIATVILTITSIVINSNYINMKDELAATKNELNDTNIALAVAKRQLLQINDSSANFLIEPELTLRIFLDYAKDKDYQKMFQMLSLDSQKTYNDVDNFVKRNPVLPLEYHGTSESGKINSVFTIASYSINSGLLLPTYRNFKDVASFDVEIMTTVDPTVRALGSLATSAIAAQYGISQVGELTNELLKAKPIPNGLPTV